MTILTLLTAAIGIAFLMWGAEWMVQGASTLAVRLGISPLVVGLTVVALGTSAPEAAVSVMSAVHGQGSMAFGNVVGSNVFNVLAIVGLTGIIAPLCVAEQVVRFDVPVMIGVSLIIAPLALDGVIGRFEGVVLLLLLVGYISALVRAGRRRGADYTDIDEVVASTLPPAHKRTWAARLAPVVQGVAGLELLVLGSRWFVSGAVEVARWLGIGELVIGLTILAIGTSLPEVAVSLVAAFRGQRDIAVGNVVGSNILNVLLVLGLASVVAPSGLPVPEVALARDLPVMIGVAIACLPIFVTDRKVSRSEGLLMVAAYVAFITYVVLDERRHAASAPFGKVLVYGLLPGVVLLFFVSLAYSLRSKRKTGSPS